MSEKQTIGLLEDIADVLGHDVYYIYPDSLHAIPPVYISAIAVGCLLEFLKGFADFNRLGQASRQAIVNLLNNWRSSRDLEPLIQTLDLRNAAYEALAIVPQDVNAHQMDEGQTALKQALLKFGMNDGLADEHSRAIRQLVQQSLTSGGGPRGR
jgi:hypothetical protein